MLYIESSLTAERSVGAIKMSIKMTMLNVYWLTREESGFNTQTKNVAK